MAVKGVDKHNDRGFLSLTYVERDGTGHDGGSVTRVSHVWPGRIAHEFIRNRRTDSAEANCAPETGTPGGKKGPSRRASLIESHSHTHARCGRLESGPSYGAS